MAKLQWLLNFGESTNFGTDYKFWLDLQICAEKFAILEMLLSSAGKGYKVNQTKPILQL